MAHMHTHSKEVLGVGLSLETGPSSVTCKIVLFLLLLRQRGTEVCFQNHV